MSRDIELAVGEEVRWEGRPAPRCYTFRHWRHSVFGFIFLIICGYWQILGLEMSLEYDMTWLAWLPTFFLLVGFYLAFGHLLQARLEWNHVCYMITDRRLLVMRGLLQHRIESLELAEITYFSLSYQGEQLGTLRIYQGGERRITLHCLEYPYQAADLLKVAIDKGLASDQVCPVLGEA